MINQDVTLHVVDDDITIRRSVAALASSVGLNCRLYASAEEFLDCCQSGGCRDQRTAGCLLIDVQLGGMNGIDLQEALHAKGCMLPVIIVSGYANVSTAVRAMRNGAVTLLEKPLQSEELIDAIQTALAMEQSSAAVQAHRRDTCHRLDMLSAREMEALELIVTGTPNKCISSKMEVSHRTVDRLRAAVFEKMGVESAVELARLVGEARPQYYSLDPPHPASVSLGTHLTATDRLQACVRTTRT